MVRILNWPRGTRSRRRAVAGGITAIALAAGLAWSAAPAAQAGTPSYEVAYQTNAGDLALVGVDNDGSLGLSMAQGTSPSIAPLGNPASPTGFVTVYQDSAGSVIDYAPATLNNLGAAAPGTSPSVAGLTNGGFEVAFQQPGGNVVAVSNTGAVTDEGLAAPGTSPSIASLPNATFEVAYQGIFGVLVTEGPDNHGPWNLDMGADTSPGIAY